MPTFEHNINFDNVFEGIKSHVKRHQVAYSFGAGIGIAGFSYLIMGGRHASFLRSLDGPETIDTLVTVRPFAFLSFFSKQDAITTLIREGRGHPGYPVWCRETGEGWFTQAEAARSAKTSAPYMSGHLTGKYPDVHGLHYERMIV